MEAKVNILRGALEQAEIALNRAHVALFVEAERSGRPEAIGARNFTLAARERVAEVLRGVSALPTEEAREIQAVGELIAAVQAALESPLLRPFDPKADPGTTTPVYDRLRSAYSSARGRRAGLTLRGVRRLNVTVRSESRPLVTSFFVIARTAERKIAPDSFHLIHFFECDEIDETSPDFANAYALTTGRGEFAIRHWFKSLGFEVLNVREV
jgi:hypothetical protein